MARMRFYGDDELVRKIEDAGMDAVEACAAALADSLDLVSARLLGAWIALPKENSTGDTAKSMRTKIEIDGDIVKARAGFSARDGGIAAAFWNVGTDYIRATHFIDEVAEESVDEVAKAQLDVLKGLLR